ncbi:MAG: zinc-dependent peptidase [Burkholderiaceae bacterium]|nr:zinc-dependent peptidase [Burkholderiaceae bacterium]
MIRGFRKRPPAEALPAQEILSRVRRASGLFEHLDAEDWAHLVDLAAELLAAKRVVGAAGFAPDDFVRWSVALQACLPVLRFGIGAYRGFVDIIVYPDLFLVERQATDEAGVVHEWREALAGEAMHGGPVVLSWPDVAEPGGPGFSVVIHEFLHKLDMLAGEADGVPPMPSARRAHWLRALDEAYEGFVDDIEAVERQIPIDIDPESGQAASYWNTLALDPYAGTDHAEFFAVAGEAFFAAPGRVKGRFPALYEAFRTYFGQDPNGS